MKRYPAPFGSDFSISRVLLEPTLTADNYRARMHELLYVEEIAQYTNISRSVVSVWLINMDYYYFIPDLYKFCCFSCFLAELDWCRWKLFIIHRRLIRILSIR